MVVEIRNVSELPIEKLQELIGNGENVEKIRIISEVGHTIDYSVEEYKKLYEKLLELVDGIDDSWSKAKKFTIIYKRISQNIEYDYVAIYKGKINRSKRRYAEKESDNCRSLKNGLLYGKCVCQGYAEILRNACAIKGIEAIEINGGHHAWNQVKIDNDQWIEIDATWGNSNMIEYIGTDKDKFWKSHPRYVTTLFEQENVVSNFDIVSFVNSELGLESDEYSKRELAEFIDLIEKRDAYKQDISSELEELKSKIDKRKRIGFTLMPWEIIYKKEKDDISNDEDKNIEVMTKGLHPYILTEIKKLLTECVITYEEACTIARFKHGKVELNTIKEIHKRICERREKLMVKEFEKECGYTVASLRGLGFSEEEIDKMQNKYNTQNGKKLNRRKIVQKSVDKKKRESMKTSERIEYIFSKFKRRILGKDEPMLLPENQDEKEKMENAKEPSWVLTDEEKKTIENVNIKLVDKYKQEKNKENESLKKEFNEH